MERRLSLPLITAVVIVLPMVIAIPVAIVIVHASHRGQCPSAATGTPSPGGIITAGFNSPYGYNGNNGHGLIDSFEIGNEEYSGFQDAKAKPCFAADNYVPVLKAGYLAVKPNAPHALVVT